MWLDLHSFRRRCVTSASHMYFRAKNPYVSLGRTKDLYQKHGRMYRGVEKVAAHRLAWAVDNPGDDFPLFTDTRLEASHFCSSTRCCVGAHIVMEPRLYNRSRSSCLQTWEDHTVNPPLSIDVCTHSQVAELEPKSTSSGPMENIYQKSSSQLSMHGPRWQKRSPNGLTEAIPAITYSKKQSPIVPFVHVHKGRTQCRGPGIHGTTFIKFKAEIVATCQSAQ